MATERVYPTGLLGKKLGMSQVFTEEGASVPVTVIQAGPCTVLQVKREGEGSAKGGQGEGYFAVQLGFDPKKPQRTTKAELGHFSKAGKGAFYHVREIRCNAQEQLLGDVGAEINVGDVFQEGQLVDVSGVTKGKGFQGVVRRFGVRGQPATRGTHEKFRNIGSIGCRKFPGRVWKNQKMPGHMGDLNVTVQNLKVVKVIPEKNIILVKGAVPSARNGLVVLRKARKKEAAA
ncbi:MAG: 50S ribosomal protein L3 [Bdellovibrionales bacterium]|nr:50S ribosomal protein L3 [Bdellovibrionales bacterium]